MMERKPHRVICSLCHEVSRVEFWVPNDIWKLSVHISQIVDLICLACFTRLSDERGVEWDKEIKFYPTSIIKHNKSMENKEAIPYYGEDNMGATPPIPVRKRICHDCNAEYGEVHQEGCDMERCPKCGGQLIGCEC